MKAINSERLSEILIELENIGDELEEIQSMQTDINIQYYISECESGLVDARVALREVL